MINGYGDGHGMEWNGVTDYTKTEYMKKTYVIPVFGAPHVASHASELGLQKPHPHSEKECLLKNKINYISAFLPPQN